MAPLKRKIKKIKHSKMFQNMSFVFLSNAVSQLLVLVSLPIALRKLGLNGWDSVVLYQLLINNIVWLTNLGFNFSATVKIAQTKSEIKRQRITAAVLIIQALTLSVFGFAAATFFSFSQTTMGLDILLNVLLMSGASILSMHWLLSGLENFKYIAIIKVLPKVILLFLLVLEPTKLTATSYLYFVSFSEISVCLGVFMLLLKSNGIRLRRFSLLLIKSIFIQSLKIFLVQCIPNARETFLKLFIAAVFADGSLAIYNVAERLKGAAITFFQPIIHVTFPNIAAQANLSATAFLSALKRAYGMQLALSVVLFFVVFLFSDLLVSLFAGDQFIRAADLLQVFSFSIIMLPLLELTLNNIFVARRKTQSYTIATLAQSFLTLFFVFIFSFVKDLTSIAVGIVTGEFFSCAFVVSYIFARRKYFFK